MTDMIDRQARNELALLIRRLATGRITNDQFEDTCPCSAMDSATIHIPSEGVWYLYCDLREYYLRGKDRLLPEQRRFAARMTLFLKSDLEYEWPTRDLTEALMGILLNLLTLGRFAHFYRWYADSYGEMEVWPFARIEDYQAALKSPPFFNGIVRRNSAGRLSLVDS